MLALAPKSGTDCSPKGTTLYRRNAQCFQVKRTGRNMSNIVNQPNSLFDTVVIVSTYMWTLYTDGRDFSWY